MRNGSGVESRESRVESSPDYRAAKEGLAHRWRPAAVVDITGGDRVAFLQGQLTQDLQRLSTAQVLPAAGLTPKGKLIFIARLIALSDRMRLLLPAISRERVLEHLKKYAAFHEVTVTDRSDDILRIGVHAPERVSLPRPPEDALLLPGEGEFSAEILAAVCDRDQIERWLGAAGSVSISDETAEILRVEAGRPRFGQDADESHLADEVGLEPAISTTKGCYVGQEIVARMRTYGRVNKRLVGFRFPGGLLAAGSVLKKPDEAEAGKLEWGRVTSAVVSPAFGPIGLGFAFREVPPGGHLVDAAGSGRGAVVANLPFA
ncbi:MAG: YgfZ/GcvT domain-containing protein [Thermoanaerobaculia bacterium]